MICAYITLFINFAQFLIAYIVGAVHFLTVTIEIQKSTFCRRKTVMIITQYLVVIRITFICHFSARLQISSGSRGHKDAHIFQPWIMAMVG